MAGETGSEFPIFKSGEGAFDRAKYKEQEGSMVSQGQLTGKEIDEDLKKKKISAEDAIKKARNFYDVSYDTSIKEIDPAIDKDSVYFREAYSGTTSDKKKIGNRIDKGEAIDGKEIVEMAKDAAKNKVNNIAILKSGKVTEIIENVGIRDIKEFASAEDVKSDFDSRVKDEKLKFDSLLSKIDRLLSYFNDKGTPMTQERYKALYTPENVAIITALAKILELEGFKSESVVNTAKNYDDSIDKLSGKGGDEKIENASTTNPPKEEAKLVKTEEKIEEKTKEPEKSAAPEPTAIKVEEKLAETKIPEPAKATETPAAPVEKPTITQPESPDKSKILSSTVENVAGISLETPKVEKPKSEQTFEEYYNSYVNDLFGGILAPKAENKEAALSSSIESNLGIKIPTETKSTAGIMETKSPIISKATENISKAGETISNKGGIKETETQKLSSVLAPAPKEEAKAETPLNASTVKQEVTKESAETSLTGEAKESSSGETKSEESTKSFSEGQEDMKNSMEKMINLLMQLNDTLQGPLIVKSLTKNFD